MPIWDINVLGEEGLRPNMLAAARERRTFSLFQHRRANGEVRDVEVHSGPVEIGGRLILYSIVHDITERKQAEKALLASEEKFRTMFNSASVGIYQGTVAGRLVTANLSMARLLDYARQRELAVTELLESIKTGFQ